MDPGTKSPFLLRRRAEFLLASAIGQQIRHTLDEGVSRITHPSTHCGGHSTMNVPVPIAITPVRVADLLAEGEVMPVYVHVIDHPDARVLVDTGLTELHPAVADMDPRIRPPSEWDFDLAGIDIVVNTHLHFDHCGGNHLFAGKPIYVQRRELDDARSQDDYTIREWVDAPGVRYIAVDSELELLPGIRLLSAPGHTPGHLVYVLEGKERDAIFTGDAAKNRAELLSRKGEATYDAGVSSTTIGRIWQLWSKRAGSVLVPGHDLPMTQKDGQVEYIGKREAALKAWFGESIEDTTLIELNLR